MVFYQSTWFVVFVIEFLRLSFVNIKSEPSVCLRDSKRATPLVIRCFEEFEVSAYISGSGLSV